MTRKVRRIVLEPTDDPKKFKAVIEPVEGDVEGHGYKWGFIEIEPIPGDPGAEPRYAVTIGDDDVEGHGARWGFIETEPIPGEPGAEPR